MANSLPNDPPPPYTATPPPLGFQSPDPPPTVRVEVQEEGGYLVGQQQYPPAYPYAHGKPVPGSTPVVVTQPQVVTQSVLILPPGTCPNCRAGVLQSEFSFCGICMAILFFPIGILCCALMMERRCSNCRMSFDSM
ncbi:membrane protein BRI3-like isoform X1 [Macrobrachium rosenbergii]|uniref:membrane protein BRI3-like isoform X1 n=1 Tax=Macrobrachium rosenbergii TaxID=79674 RepID=UPI0034D3DF5A